MLMIPFRTCLFLGSLLAMWCLPVAAAPCAQRTHNALIKPYEKWLDEDARWIITDQERADFAKLTTDRQCDEFIEAFWNRRNPTPGDKENKFKEEHYRRIAYSNQHFAERVAGFRTDRGQIYIVYGPPDHVEKKSKGSGLGQPTQYPSEMWRYKIMLDVGRDVSVEFIDSCQCGEYHLPDPDKFAHPGNQF